MSFYADTSFFFSLYGSDANSARADAWRQANPVGLPFTALHRLELKNAFWLAVFQKRMTVPEAAGLWRGVESDLATGVLKERALSLGELFRAGEALVQSHTAETGSRSLDILHVAAAQSLAARLGLRLATV